VTSSLLPLSSAEESSPFTFVGNGVAPATTIAGSNFGNLCSTGTHLLKAKELTSFTLV
jgi:hypothetical protein